MRVARVTARVGSVLRSSKPRSLGDAGSPPLWNLPPVPSAQPQIDGKLYF